MTSFSLKGLTHEMQPLLSTRSTTVVVDTRGSSVVGVAIIVEVNLLDTSLQDGDHSAERAKTVGVDGARGVRLVERDDGVVATFDISLCLVLPCKELED